MDDQGTVWFGKRICVPEIKSIREAILREAHDSAYSIHSGSTKMYLELKERYWWYGLKRDVAEYVAICDTCQRLKAEHQRPAGLLQPMKIPEWKWEVGMDCIVGLPTSGQSWQSCTWKGLCVYMGCQRKLFRKEGHSLHHTFGRNYMSPWIQS